VGNIDFKVIFATKNSNKFPKTRFWKEKSVEEVVTLGRTAQATLVYMVIIHQTLGSLSYELNKQVRC
jgi:hypothetical protein